VLFATDTRYYLAKNLRTFDLRYADALEIAQPLVTSHSHNPIFLLLIGNLNVELGRNAAAVSYFRAALDSPNANEECSRRVKQLADEFLSNLE